jgi:hypothetical protein
MQENRLLPPEAYVQSDAYANLAVLLEDTFLNYMVRPAAAPWPCLSDASTRSVPLQCLACPLSALPALCGLQL